MYLLYVSEFYFFVVCSDCMTVQLVEIHLIRHFIICHNVHMNITVSPIHIMLIKLLQCILYCFCTNSHKNVSILKFLCSAGAYDEIRTEK